MNNIFEIIIKIENNNMNEMNDVVSVMLWIIRLSKENYELDYTILLIFRFDIPFRKM